MDSPIGLLIGEALQKASKRSGLPYVAHAKDCTCSVEIAYFTPDSTRQNYSRCHLHKLKR